MAGMVVAAMSAIIPSLIPGVAALRGSQDPWLATAGLAVVAAVALAMYLLISWALVRGVDRRPFRALGLSVTPRAAIGLLIAMAATVGMVVGASGAVQALGWGRHVDYGSYDAVPALAIIVNVLLLAFVLQGIGEEVIFRGYLLQSLSRRPVVAVVVSALAFGVMRLVSNGGQESMLERVCYLAIPTGFALHAGFHVATAVSAALGITVTGPAQWVASGLVLAAAAVVVGLLIPRSRWAEVAVHGPYGR